MSQTYFIPARIDDGFGEGVRLHTNRDDLYEARRVGDAGVRIYSDGTRWNTKIHLPAPDEPRDAYDPFDTVAERIDTAYDTELITPATTFLEHMSEEDVFSVEDADDAQEYALRYSIEPETGPASPDEWGRYMWPTLLGYLGGGAASGATAGSTLTPGDPLGMVAGAVAGAVGGFGAALKEEELYLNGSPYSPVRNVVEGAVAVKRTVQRSGDETDVEQLAGATLWDRVNEKRRLEAVADETRNVEEAERYLELKDTDIEATVDELLDAQFASFEDRPGITASAATETYTEAIDFAAAALDRNTPGYERSSIYHDADVFGRLFAAVPQEEQERLVEQVLDGDAAEPVESYLNTEHTELVQAVGAEHALQGGVDG